MAIPAALPISLSQITTEFGGTSLLTAAANAGLPAGAVSFSSFAGLTGNAGSGSFTAGDDPGTTAVGFSTIFGTYGTWNNAYMPGNRTLQSLYQQGTQLTIRASFFNNANFDSTFSTLKINGVTLNRSAALFTNDGYVQWLWFDVPAGLLVNGSTYTPYWTTA
jgi:hypothetical protein